MKTLTTLRIYINMLVIGLLVFISCKTTKDRYPEPINVYKEVNKSTDYVRIPKANDTDVIRLYHYIKDFSDQLHLPPLDSSEGCVEVRAWFNIGGLSKEQKVICVKFKNDVFESEQIKFDGNWSNRGTKFSVVNFKKSTTAPKSGWHVFAGKFYAENFISLFNLNTEVRNSGGTDGDKYILELISNKHYWFSDYRELFADTLITGLGNLAKSKFEYLEEEFSF